ncbi:MAG TPA: DUF2339 domain-containing protein [Bryobacteraceae bacterium]|nr:DUF2339 domain-containing protein [Bryobacteraceae bacterium]
MEIVIILFLLLAVLAVWVNLRDRIERLEYKVRELGGRVDIQSRTVAELLHNERPAPKAEPRPAAPLPPPPPKPEPVVVPVREPEPVAIAAPPPPPPQAPPPPEFLRPAPAPAAVRSSAEWEAVLGGNLLNKIGVFVLVVGIALALGYSFTQFGPLGRVSIGILASLALLISGAVMESRERYSNFARGLLGGGWAALYVTVYAMHAVPAAKVIDSPLIGGFLLMGVAAAMIVHSLRYRSQTVTGLAYFVAFGTLAITDVASLPFLALVPLAASLLYLAHRFTWSRMTLLGMIATYAVVVLRGDTGAPLWQAQTIFAAYWLLFEIYDVLHPEIAMLAINAAGALGLSLLKWQTAAPDKMWMLLAAAAAAYLVSAAARIRSGKWHGPATLTAALAAAAIFQRLDRQWVASALAVEAELFYLAGVRLRKPYLRWLGTSLFGVEVLRLLSVDVWMSPVAQWVPVASVDVVLFFANRALCAVDTFYGYAGAAMAALIIGKESHEPYRSVLWQAAAAAAFAFGWWRRQFDFRLQGYLLLALGLTGAALETRVLPLSVAAGVCYAAVLCLSRSAPGRFLEIEPEAVRPVAAAAAVAALMAILWREVPGAYLGVAWMALTLPLLELGLRRLPDEFRYLSYAAAVIGTFRVCVLQLTDLGNTGPWEPRLIPLWAALLAYAIALRARRADGGLPLIAGTSTGIAFGLTAMWALLPADMVAPAWAVAALVLFWTGGLWKRQVFLWQSYLAAAFAYVMCLSNLPDLARAAWTSCAVISCLYAAQMLAARADHARLYFSLMATTLTTMLLYYRISGSLLTVACGMQGIILLAAGFPLRDRVLRVSGLALLLSCILKLFVWDLRHLETFPRILSFIVLGLILLAVSWIYTRFREQVAKFL